MERILEFAKEQYGWEAQRRDKLNSSSSIPVGFATIGGTITTSIASKIQNPWDYIELTLLGFIGLSTIFGAVFTYHTVRFFLGPVYKYTAESDEVLKFWHDTSEHHKSYPELGKPEKKFDDFLVQTYSKCATVNCRNNDRKSHRLYLMNCWVLVMLAPCLLAGLILSVSQIL
jgi:hypothetical protein